MLRDRLLRSMLVLYPRSWRRRYSEELGDLSEELLAAGEVTRLRLGLGLVRSALAERVRRRRAFVLLSSCAAVLVVVGVVLFATDGPGRGSARRVMLEPRQRLQVRQLKRTRSALMHFQALFQVTLTPWVTLTTPMSTVV